MAGLIKKETYLDRIDRIFRVFYILFIQLILSKRPFFVEVSYEYCLSPRRRIYEPEAGQRTTSLTVGETIALNIDY